MKKVVEAVRALGGNVVGVSGIVNRGNVTAEDVGDVPKFRALLNLQLPKWKEEDCPLCKEKVPVNEEVGRGREYLVKKNRSGP